MPYIPTRFHLPADLNREMGSARITNFGMLFSMCIPSRYHDGESEGNFAFNSQHCHKHLKDYVVKEWNEGAKTIVSDDIEHFCNRHIQAASEFSTSTGAVFIEFTAESVSPLAIGLGNAASFENGLTLHRTIGLPYLPGSSLKGVIRNFMMEEYTQAAPAEEIPSRKADVDMLFGVQNTSGVGVFWDMLPCGSPSFMVDIMNPHFQDYYQSDLLHPEPPADWLQPNPVFFLTVAPGAVFKAALTIRPAKDLSRDRMDQLAEVLEEYTVRALLEWGVGSKTRKGYGRFNAHTS